MKNHLPDDVAKEVGPYLSRIFAWVDRGVTAFLRDQKERMFIFEKRTIFGMIRDYIKNEVIAGSDGDVNIHKVTKKNLFLFIINQKYAIKIKKLNKKLISSSAHSNQLTLFFDSQLSLPGLFETPKCIEVGYVPDELISKHNGVFLTNRKESWYWEVLSENAVINLAPEVNKTKRKRVKPKETKIINISGGQSQQ